MELWLIAKAVMDLTGHLLAFALLLACAVKWQRSKVAASLPMIWVVLILLLHASFFLSRTDRPTCFSGATVVDSCICCRECHQFRPHRMVRLPSCGRTETPCRGFLAAFAIASGFRFCPSVEWGNDVFEPANEHGIASLLVPPTFVRKCTQRVSKAGIPSVLGLWSFDLWK
jgi:hypothetical protein